MQAIDFWRFSEGLTIVQAALLFTGHDPAKHPSIEQRTSGRPEGYEAMKHAIVTAIQNNTLDGKISYETNGNYEESYICHHASTVNVDSLKNWLHAKGVRSHPFYFPEDSEEKYLNKDHPRYAPKLAAAIKAWNCLLYTSPSPRDGLLSRMPSSA